MPLIRYRSFNFRPATVNVIEKANEILHQYHAQGFDLTVRQLYYQFVARDLIENNQSEYNKLGSIVNDARMAGEIDWDYITDRTRYIREFLSFDDPADRIKSAARNYALDLLEGQGVHVEAWVEKDALIDVVARAVNSTQVPHLSCRGYVSQSEMWKAGQRLSKVLNAGQKIVILHLGDHDPSGVDMTRDIESRLGDFVWAHSPESMNSGDFAQLFEVRRIALSMDQVAQYNPPENFAKLTDSRAGVVRKSNQIVGIKEGSYIDRFSKLDDDHDPQARAENTPSWELDALEPQVIVDLITDNLDELLDMNLVEQRRERQEEERKILLTASDRWSDVVEFLQD